MPVCQKDRSVAFFPIYLNHARMSKGQERCERAFDAMRGIGRRRRRKIEEKARRGICWSTGAGRCEEEKEEGPCRADMSLCAFCVAPNNFTCTPLSLDCKPCASTRELIVINRHAKRSQLRAATTGISAMEAAQPSCFSVASIALNREQLKGLSGPAGLAITPGYAKNWQLHAVCCGNRALGAPHPTFRPVSSPNCVLDTQHFEISSLMNSGTAQSYARTWQLQAARQPGVVAVRRSELMVTTNWKDLDIEEVRALLAATEQNCDQFPRLDAQGSICKVDPVKLKRAIQHSFIVVAVIMRGELEEDYYMDRPQEPRRPWLAKRTLVAFGRVTSDRALTASIHDIAVAPTLQRQGLGRRLVERIVREIVRYDISDISVLAGRQSRPFFRACGFGSDVLGSTAMMYIAVAAAGRNASMLQISPSLQES